MGNTMGIDMGNTFCALHGPATHFLREAELLHTSSQTPSIGPLGACDEVCSSSSGTGEISLQKLKCYPCVCSKCYPCLCALPTPALSLRERENHSAPQEEPSVPRGAVVQVLVRLSCAECRCGGSQL